MTHQLKINNRELSNDLLIPKKEKVQINEYLDA